MQYWKNFKNGKMERLDDSQLEKHPEKLESLKRNGYVRVVSETDNSLFSDPKKKKTKKKKKSKK